MQHYQRQAFAKNDSQYEQKRELVQIDLSVQFLCHDHGKNSASKHRVSHTTWPSQGCVKEDKTNTEQRWSVQQNRSDMIIWEQKNIHHFFKHRHQNHSFSSFLIYKDPKTRSVPDKRNNLAKGKEMGTRKKDGEWLALLRIPGESICCVAFSSYFVTKQDCDEIKLNSGQMKSENELIASMPCVDPY